MQLASTDPEVKDGWIVGDGLWRVAFTPEALTLIQHLSGLVEVCATYYDLDRNHLIFIVKCTDTTSTLFRGGLLIGTPIHSYRESNQPLLVERMNDRVTIL